MQLTKTIFSDSVIFIEKKRVENRLLAKSEFFVGKKKYSSAILEALTHLSSEFGAKYAEAKVWAGDYQFKRKPCCPGKHAHCKPKKSVSPPPGNRLRDTTAHRTCRMYSVVRPRMQSDEPRGLVSDARRRSTPPTGPFRIGSKHHDQGALAAERLRLRFPAQSRAVSGGRTAADGAGPGLASTSSPKCGGRRAALPAVGAQRALTLAPTEATGP